LQGENRKKIRLPSSLPPLTNGNPPLPQQKEKAPRENPREL